MDKPMTFIGWCSSNGKIPYSVGIEEAYEAGQQSQQAKVEEQAQEIANLKSLIQGHELRHQQNLSIKQKLTRRSEELQKRVDAALKLISEKSGDIHLNDCMVLGRFVDAGQLEQALKGEGQ